MSNDNTVLIAGAVIGFLYLQRQAKARAVLARPGGVASMPGSAGTGLQQIATGAVAGFMRQLSASPTNNTSSTAFPVSGYATPFNDPTPRGGVINEAVPALPDNLYDYSGYADYSGAAFA